MDHPIFQIFPGLNCRFARLAFSCMIPRDLLHLDGGLLPGDPSMVFGTTGLLDPGSLA